MDLASAEAEIRHVFGDTPITEASIGAAPPDILVKLSEYAVQEKYCDECFLGYNGDMSINILSTLCHQCAHMG